MIYIMKNKLFKAALVILLASVGTACYQENNLLAHWPFDDNTRDVIGNGHDVVVYDSGAVSKDLKYIQGRSGKAL